MCELGSRWSKIAAHFPGRTDNEIKNHWNTRIKKKMKNMGLDPLTHKPIIDHQTLNSASTQSEEIHEIQETASALPPLRDYRQMEDKATTTVCGSNQDKNGTTCIKNMWEMGSNSVMVQNREPCTDYYYQSWIDNPFFWDSLATLEDTFP